MEKIWQCLVFYMTLEKGAQGAVVKKSAGGKLRERHQYIQPLVPTAKRTADFTKGKGIAGKGSCFVYWVSESRRGGTT